MGPGKEDIEAFEDPGSGIERASCLEGDLRKRDGIDRCLGLLENEDRARCKATVVSDA